MFDMKKIGRKIYHHRLQLEMTDEQFSSEVGIATNYLRSIEAGIYSPSIKTLVKMCNLFGVSADYLLSGDENTIHPRIHEESSQFENYTQEELISQLKITNAIEQSLK